MLRKETRAGGTEGTVWKNYGEWRNDSERNVFADGIL